MFDIHVYRVRNIKKKNVFRSVGKKIMKNQKGNIQQSVLTENKTTSPVCYTEEEGKKICKTDKD